jgi:hypothetical protein
MPLTRLIHAPVTVAFLVAVALLIGNPAFAQGDQGSRRLNLLPPIVGVSGAQHTHTLSGIALDGFDPVSYFLAEEPTPGLPELETIWGGAAWRFASRANQAAFLSSPDAYAPRLGGYDALAMARGKAVEASPRIATVVDRRLYLFRSLDERDRFLAEKDAAAQAERLWPEKSRQLMLE